MRRLLMVVLMLSVAGPALASVTGSTSDTLTPIEDPGTPYGIPDASTRVTGDIIGASFILYGRIEWGSYPPFPANGQRNTFPFVWHQTVGGGGALPFDCAIIHNNNPSDPESFVWTVVSDSMGHAAVTLTEGNGNHQLCSGHAYRFEVTTAGYNTLSYDFTVGSDGTAAGEPSPMIRPRLDLPNPLMGGSEVRYRVPSTGRAQIDVFDLHGRLVRRLVRESVVQAGEHGVHWDGRSDTGALVSSGVHFFRLTTDAGRTTGNCVLLR